MSDVQEKCATCQAILDEEDLFCANCGTEAPHPDVEQVRAENTTHVFKCTGCGASMSYDASVQALHCPFCGGDQLESKADELSIAPKFVLPAVLDRTQADQSLRTWLGKGFWRPSDLKTAAVVTKMTLVYVPFWIFRAQTFTYWTADSSATPAGARGDWVPLSGEHRGSYSGLLIGASSVLTPGELKAVEPFDFSTSVPREAFDLDRVTYEQFCVPKRYARPEARSGFESLESGACQKFVPGRCRNMKVNIRYEALGSDPVLLPFWIMAYTYQQQTHRFLINGQTGKSTGTAPTSVAKIAAAIAIGAAVVFGVVLCVMMCAGLMTL